ncbi:hypothetical protein RhiJN_21437 [Ceratobasidium sp. AG-Ba]|nr:hypothetical protein RhiJN_21437 [Ceratobasidium sp. AG-Ba]
MSHLGSQTGTPEQQDLANQSAGPQQPASRARQSSASDHSAAALACDEAKFTEWQHAARLAPVIRDLDMTQPNSWPATIRQLLLAAKRIPTWVSDMESTHLAQVVERYPKQTRDLCTRILGNLTFPTSARLFELHDEEDPELTTAIPEIIRISHRTNVLLCDSQACPNEAELRAGVDLLLWEIFPRDGHIVHMLQRSLKLPEVGVQPVVASVELDAIDVIRFPSLGPYSLDMRYRLSCFSASQPPVRLEVVHCVTSYESNVKGERQAQMGIVSAMYQRCALGIKDQFVFGIIHKDGLNFRVIAAKWQYGKIDVYTLGVFHLDQSIAMLRFFLLLREIRRIGHGYRNEIIHAMDRRDSFTIIGQISSKPWVPSKFKSVRHSGSSSDSVDETDESDDDHDDQTEVSASDESRFARTELEAAVLSWSSRIDPCSTDRSPTPYMDADLDLDLNQSCLLSGMNKLVEGESTNLWPLGTSPSSECGLSALVNSLEIGVVYGAITFIQSL